MRGNTVYQLNDGIACDALDFGCNAQSRARVEKTKGPQNGARHPGPSLGRQLFHLNGRGVTENTVTIRDLLDDFTASYLPQLNDGGRGAYKDSFGLFRQYFVDERGNPVVATIRPTDISKFVDRNRALRRKGKRKAAPTAAPS